MSSIVTSMDATHDEYICRAMELGCDVITEKPMTTDAEKCRRILDTQRRTGRAVRVTFNYRYSPPRTQVKELLMSGVIGEVLSVDFHWLLDTRHGADYFRRWHRNRANSGSLLVHKATHHFDLVNWWLDARPSNVFATGHRASTRPQRPTRYGLTDRGERCLGCPEADKCAFYLDLRATTSCGELYLDNEQHDGYFRDRCVFSEQIDIEDTMSRAACSYDNGASMSYSPQRLHAVGGLHDRLQRHEGPAGAHCEETVYISGDGIVPGELGRRARPSTSIRTSRPAY